MRAAIGCLLLAAGGVGLSEPAAAANVPPMAFWAAIVVGGLAVLSSLLERWLASTDADEERQSLLRAARGVHSPAVTGRHGKYLYVSHTLSALTDRVWQFAVPVLFMDIFVDSLLPSALFVLFSNLTAFALMTHVGMWVDRTPRLKLVQTALMFENGSIVVAAGLLLFLARAANVGDGEPPAWTPAVTAGFAGTVAFSVLSDLMGQASTLAVERDWIVRMCAGDSHTLTHLNSSLFRIDLLCKVFGPLLFGVMLSAGPSTAEGRVVTGALAVAALNAVAYFPSTVLLREVYYAYPVLHQPRDGSKAKARVSVWQQFRAGWGKYRRHQVFGASLAYCMLYMTTLDNSALMTAYLKWRGVTEGLLGGARGLGALFGVLGTLMFPSLTSCCGSLERAGLFAIWAFLAMLSPIAVSMLLTGSLSTPVDLSMLVCVTVSRCMLWSFDLAETQIMQEQVEAEDSGVLNGTQTATYQLFMVVMSVLGTVFHRPEQFETLMWASLGGVSCSAVVFTWWYVRRSSSPVTSSV